ncbi:hypothetical protein C8J56DRAFT_899867 [Mycena floridula]|nr:hypothetical protein C8J56DRAFT_899867 [Mycena floridula]
MTRIMSMSHTCEKFQKIWIRNTDTDRLPNVSHFTHGPLHLSRVCQRWKSVVLSHQALWSNFSAYCSEYDHSFPGYEALPSAVQRFLKTSGSLPLTFHIANPQSKPGARGDNILRRIVALLLAQSRRWISAFFAMSIYGWCIVAADGISSGSLKSLCIDVGFRLTSLFLNVENAGPSTIEEFQSLTSQLDILRIDLESDDFEEVDAMTFPTVRSLEWDCLDGSVTSSFLCDWLTLPSLHELRIHGVFDWEEENLFADFLESFESLILRSQCSLEIRRFSEKVATNQDAFNLIALFKKLTINDTTAGFIPRLKVLDLDLCVPGLDQDIIGTFLDMVESRAPSAANSTEQPSSHSFLEEVGKLTVDLEGYSDAVERIARLRNAGIRLNIDG